MLFHHLAYRPLSPAFRLRALRLRPPLVLALRRLLSQTQLHPRLQRLLRYHGRLLPLGLLQVDGAAREQGLHPGYVPRRGLLVVDDRGGVVRADEAPAALLKGERGFPGLVDVLRWVLGQLRHPLPDVVSFLVFVSEEGDGRVHLPVLVEEG